MDFADLATREKIQRNVLADINAYAARTRPNRFSTRLSPSSLGKECVAELWYSFRWATAPKPADGRMSRYNQRGDENEVDVAKWLRETGWTIKEIDPATNEQWAVSAFNGHLYGKSDGIGSHPLYTNGIDILLEYKYVNGKRFTSLTTKPLLTADPKYYTQVCLYMYLMNLPACLFIPACRNDEDLKPVIIPRDDTQVKMIMEKAEAILTAKQRPARIAENPAFYECKLCDHVDVCHYNKPLNVSCRSCVKCVPIVDGKFHCERWNATIPNKEAILAACPEWVSV